MSKEIIDVLLAEKRTFPPTKEFSEKAHIKNIEEYERLYKKSVEDPDGFWAEMAEKQLIAGCYIKQKKWDSDDFLLMRIL